MKGFPNIWSITGVKTCLLYTSDLDPHTVYIPAKDMQRVNEEMVGNFGGVGVQFYKYLETVTVVKVVPGGPSEAAGVQDGDRIVKVNDSIVAGRNMNTDKIMSLMRGEIGTDVQPVSYTHLDVYKRQEYENGGCLYRNTEISHYGSRDDLRNDIGY